MKPEKNPNRFSKGTFYSNTAKQLKVNKNSEINKKKRDLVTYKGIHNTRSRVLSRNLAG